MRELEYASRHLTSIEINSTFYGSQKPASFARWHAETPRDFVFSVKAPRYATNRRVLAEAGDSIRRFFDSGVLLLEDKLGPINWQLPPGKKFEPADFEAFLALLPARIGDRSLRHAIEARDTSFDTPVFRELAQRHDVAIVVAGDARFPAFAEATGPFVYARIMGTTQEHRTGYAPRSLHAWATQAGTWASSGRDVFLYVISGFKERNPAAAVALIERVRGATRPAPAQRRKR
jgi:uncharacterized protein YecE (DUF72 family)